ncbi:MAG: hypothetical protein U0T81_00035 [Saprospiraceae bacterium]
MKRLIFILMIFGGWRSAFTQMGGFQPKVQPGTGKISGLVIDSATREPLAYANIVLREALEHKDIDGVLAGIGVSFSLRNLKMHDTNWSSRCSVISRELSVLLKSTKTFNRTNSEAWLC